MADNQVLNESLVLCRKIRHLGHFLLQHLQFNDHVPKQMAARGVSERAVVGQLVNLTDVVQERARQEKVPVNHFWIIAAHQVTKRQSDRTWSSSPPM